MGCASIAALSATGQPNTTLPPPRSPAGFLAQFSPILAKVLIDAGVHREVISVLSFRDPTICSYAAWAVEQMGQFSEVTAMPLIAAGAMNDLLAAYGKHAKTHETARKKIKVGTQLSRRHVCCTRTLPITCSFVASCLIASVQYVTPHRCVSRH